MSALEHEWKDDDRRDVNLRRILARVEAADPETALLGRRERDVLRATSHGLVPSEVAVVLGLSPNTVKQFQHRARVKLAAKTNAHAVAEAIRLRLIL